MRDLISRQAAIDALAKHEKSNGHNYTLFVDIVSECAEIIRDLPSAQPEPHYCRECKWSRCHINVDKYGNTETYWHCFNWDGGTDEEGYCYEWERRTNE